MRTIKRPLPSSARVTLAWALQWWVTALAPGGHVTHKSKDLADVMVERFGDVAGYVGPPPGREAAE